MTSTKNEQKELNNIGIQIGSMVEKETIKEAGEQLQKLIRVSNECGLEQETIRALIAKFGSLCSVNNTSVSNNHLISGSK